MPITYLGPKIIKIGTSLFMLLCSGHCDLPEQAEPVMTSVPTYVADSTTTTTTVKTEMQEITAGFNPHEQDFTASTISVSSITVVLWVLFTDTAVTDF